MASSRADAAVRKKAVRRDVATIVAGIRDAVRDGAFFVDPKLLDTLEGASDFSATADGRLVDPAGLAEIGATHVPAARDELEAVVREADAAATGIMSAAERIERIVESVDESIRDRVAEQLTDIYQACSFQDITGQRLKNADNTLENIMFVAASALAVLGDEGARGEVDDHIAAARDSARPQDEAELLHGPQLEGGGNSQDEIDNILASFD